MTNYESYQAVASSVRAELLADSPSPFTIEVRFLGGLTDEQQAAFAAAADRWARMIVGDLPAVVVDGETIDDILILADGTDIDGPSGILGQAGPTILRPAAAGTAAMLPAKGVMSFDSADLAAMQADGSLGDVITHEMGHVLGIGSIWQTKSLLANATSSNPTFTGAGAMREFAALLSDAAPVPVPVENTGGPGTRGSHWRETVFGNELMSGFIAAAGNPISRVTVASLGDLGYEVDVDAAEPYTLSGMSQVERAGAQVDQQGVYASGTMRRVPHRVLPDASLVAAGAERRD